METTILTHNLKRNLSKLWKEGKELSCFDEIITIKNKTASNLRFEFRESGDLDVMLDIDEKTETKTIKKVNQAIKEFRRAGLNDMSPENKLRIMRLWLEEKRIDSFKNGMGGPG